MREAALELLEALGRGHVLKEAQRAEVGVREVRVGQHRLHHRLVGGEELGDPLVLERGQRPLGVEAVVGEERGAARERPEQAAEAGDVKQRQRGVVTIVGAGVPDAGDADPATDERLVGDHRAARLRGRPRRVQDQGEIAQRDALSSVAQRCLVDGVAERVERRAVDHARWATLAHHHDRAQAWVARQRQRLRICCLRQAGQGRVAQLGEVDVIVGDVVGDQRDDVGVLDDRVELRGAVSRVDRDHGGAEQRGAEDRRDQVRMVGHQHPDVLPRADAQTGQRPRDRPAARCQFVVGQAQVGEHDRLLLRGAAG